MNKIKDLITRELREEVKEQVKIAQEDRTYAQIIRDQIAEDEKARDEEKMLSFFSNEELEDIAALQRDYAEGFYH